MKSKSKKQPGKGHFAVRQLPDELLHHYRAKGILDTIKQVRFWAEGMATLDPLMPYVEVTRNSPNGLILEEWVWQYQGPGKALPKQIFRTYRQQERLCNIQTVTCHMDDRVPTVVVDTGNIIETWIWNKGNSSGEKVWSGWALDSTADANGTLETYDYAPWVMLRPDTE